MRIFYWNARGLGNPKTRQMLKKLCLKNKPDIVLLSEPCIDFDQVHRSFWNAIGMKPFAFNNKGSRKPNLWCLCVPSLVPDVLVSATQYCAF